MNDTINIEGMLTPRQAYILSLIGTSQGLTREEIQQQMASRYALSKPTLIRELNLLAKHKNIRSEGVGRSTLYTPYSTNPLLNFIDIDAYFEDEPDNRLNVHQTFDFTIYNNLHDLFNPQELGMIRSIQKSFHKQTESMESDLLRRELERFTIELSWKSSKIEGNTYNLLDTEALILQNKKATGHSEHEATMILNHKEAFQLILSSLSEFKSLNGSCINQLHNTLVKNLEITPGIRKNAVGITGTLYKPLDNQHQIQEAMEKLVQLVNNTPNVLEKALIAHVMIPYIQPYSDGNKRTARMLTNAILLSHDYYPLSYRSVDETEFKKAIIIFYEQHSIYQIKRLFIEQLIFAINTYFQK